MACEVCERAPETMFYRWGNANIKIEACREHLAELQRALNAEQAAGEPANMTAGARVAYQLREGGRITDWKTTERGDRSLLVLYTEGGVEAWMEIR